MKRTLYRLFIAAVMIGGILPMTGLAQDDDRRHYGNIIVSNNQQIPWEASSIEGNFYFSAPSVRLALEFYFYYNAGPEPGRRTWRQVNPTTWIERYPSGRETVFIVARRSTIKGNKGFVARKVAGDGRKTSVTDNTFEVFIPDRDAEELWAMFRHYVDGRWLEWKDLAEITYFR